MHAPLLSICIPTYNRADCLKQCLNTITSQCKDPFILNNVEIVISDNASIDATENVVKEFQANFTNIHYYKNSQNIGFDRNLVQVVDKSSGEYCLTLGDDDGLFPDSINHLLEELKQHKSPYYIANCWGYDHDLIHPIMSSPNRKITHNVTYDTLGEFVRSIKDYTDLVGNFGGISMQIFKRDIWMNFKEKEKYFDSQAVHLFILLSAFKEEKVVLIAKPIVKTRNDNMRWDICPGFETVAKRQESTMKIALWISDLYNLSLSEEKMKWHFLKQNYIISLKNFVKRILFKLGIRKH